MSYSNNASIDLISLILVLYFIRYLIWRTVELFQKESEIIGTVSAKRCGFLNLFHWITIESKINRMELNISRSEVGLMAEGDMVRVTFKGDRINSFEIIKSNFEK